jgi:rod shape-determining protein MreD
MSIASIPSFGSLAPVRGRRSPARALAAVGGALLLAALLQTAGAAYWPLGWPRPDLVLTIAVAWGYLRGGGEGFLAGAVGGALLDLSSSGPFGLHVLALGLATLIVANHTGPFASSLLRRVAGALLAGAIVHLVLMTVMQLRGWDVWWSAALFRAMLPALAVDAALVLVWYVLLRRLPEPALEPLGMEAR